MVLIPVRYARVLRQREIRTLLGGYGASLLGDGMSVVSVAALALRIGAGPHRSLIVGASVAAYSLPAVLGALDRIARPPLASCIRTAPRLAVRTAEAGARPSRPGGHGGEC